MAIRSAILFSISHHIPSAIRTPYSAPHITCMYYRYIEPSTERMHGKNDYTWLNRWNSIFIVSLITKLKVNGGGKNNQLSNNIKVVFFCSRKNFKINFLKWNMKYEIENRKKRIVHWSFPLFTFLTCLMFDIRRRSSKNKFLLRKKAREKVKRRIDISWIAKRMCDKN